MVKASSRRAWVTIGWICAVVATALNGVIVGYGAIWLQFFGETADAEDYRVSAGGYGAATVVLLLAVPAVVAHGAPRWIGWLAGAAAVGLGLLTVHSAVAATRAEQVSSPIDTVWDGVGGVVWAPWTWVLIVLGLRGLYRLINAGSR